MMGRTMTVALGPKGNNLSLGGKVSQVSAEDAYTVGLYHLWETSADNSTWLLLYLEKELFTIVQMKC